MCMLECMIPKGCPALGMPLRAGELDKTSRGPFQPKPFCVSHLCSVFSVCLFVCFLLFSKDTAVTLKNAFPTVANITLSYLIYTFWHMKSKHFRWAKSASVIYLWLKISYLQLDSMQWLSVQQMFTNRATRRVLSADTLTCYFPY